MKNVMVNIADQYPIDCESFAQLPLRFSSNMVYFGDHAQMQVLS